MKYSKPKFIVINGPNLNNLAKRENEHYGQFTYKQLEAILFDEAKKLKIDIVVTQSNDESEIVRQIQKADDDFDGVLLNPAGFGYTSVAIRDAITSLSIPVIEVHLSNIQKRELFRQRTLSAPACFGQISGMKEISYLAGLYALTKLFEKP